MNPAHVEAVKNIKNAAVEQAGTNPWNNQTGS
jgi:hypothetical protein